MSIGMKTAGSVTQDRGNRFKETSYEKKQVFVDEAAFSDVYLFGFLVLVFQVLLP